MIITYHGHAMFSIETTSGLRIVMDAYDESVGYPMTRLKADVVTQSHQHHDHNHLACLDGNPKVIKEQGIFPAGEDLRITGYPSYHDEVQGKKRGYNLLYKVETEGLALLHLGDLGHVLTKDMVAAIGNVDVLMVPVGGYYTIDAAEAAAVCKALRPGVILPMHYQTTYSADMPIAKVDAFLSLIGIPPEQMLLMRVTKGDLSEQPPLAVLQIAPPQE